MMSGCKGMNCEMRSSTHPFISFHTLHKFAGIHRTRIFRDFSRSQIYHCWLLCTFYETFRNSQGSYPHMP